jgi:fumarylacetoacetate (FAA) hydrolase family protein
MLDLPEIATLVGRVWRAGIGPSVGTLRRGQVFDPFAKAAPFLREGLASLHSAALQPDQFIVRWRALSYASI